MKKKLQRVSEYFNIENEEYKKTGAFDPVVGVDSLFFVDPLLLSKTAVPELENGLDKVRKYFADVITLLKTKNQKARAQAIKRMTLKEVRGVGIGYGNKTDDGSAIGPELARRLIGTAEELLEMGVEDPAIFEVMGLFEEDFGPDRMSDGIIRILKEDLLNYSERITKELGIKEVVTKKTYEKEYVLAKHPYADKPIIFIPETILKDLPVAHSYEQISTVAVFNEALRKKFNELISPCFLGKKDDATPTKKEIKRFILENKETIKALVEIYQTCLPKSYDFAKDPAGLHLWLEKAKSLVNDEPIEIPDNPTEKDLESIVQKVIGSFKKFIETKGRWKVLYNDKGKPLNESHAHHFFFATAYIYCELCDIDISPETNAGRGPVDFKLSQGHKNKIVVEIKLTKGNVRQGYEKQTRLYQETEEAKSSYYVVVQVTEKSKALDDILKQSEDEDKENKPHPEIITVDGRPQEPASKA